MKIIECIQGSLEWKKIRLGKVTGTRLKSAIGTKIVQKTLITELIAEVETEQPKEKKSSPVMERGTSEEEFAIKRYEQLTGAKTEAVGLCVHDTLKWLALSPDRFIKIGKKYKKGVEVKCPNSDTMIKYRMNLPNIPAEHRPQILEYFIVNEDMDELDLVIYDERFISEDMKMLIITITRAKLKEELEETMKILKDFRKLWLSYKDKLLNNNF